MGLAVILLYESPGNIQLIVPTMLLLLHMRDNSNVIKIDRKQHYIVFCIPGGDVTDSTERSDFRIPSHFRVAQLLKLKVWPQGKKNFHPKNTQYPTKMLLTMNQTAVLSTVLMGFVKFMAPIQVMRN